MHNPAIFYDRKKDMTVEQHGDDSFCEGDRGDILEMKTWFYRESTVEKADVISMHRDDAKEGWYLHRRTFVDQFGWHEELEEKYTRDLVECCGVDSAHSLSSPGYKDKAKEISEKFSPKMHTKYRGGAGMAQYMSDRRGDVSFSVKEVLRRASSPTMEDDVKLKRIGKYVKGMPRCVQDCP